MGIHSTGEWRRAEHCPPAAELWRLMLGLVRHIEQWTTRGLSSCNIHYHIAHWSIPGEMFGVTDFWTHLWHIFKLSVLQIRSTIMNKHSDRTRGYGGVQHLVLILKSEALTTMHTSCHSAKLCTTCTSHYIMIFKYLFYFTVFTHSLDYICNHNA